MMAWQALGWALVALNFAIGSKSLGWFLAGMMVASLAQVLGEKIQGGS